MTIVPFATGCGGGHKAAPRATTTSSSVPAANALPLGAPTCPVPKPGVHLDWLASAPPLPAGTVPTIDYPLPAGAAPQANYHSGLVVVPITLDGFVQYALSDWPLQGWRLIRGEREALEAEGGAVRNGNDFAAFRVVNCGTGKAMVVVTTARQVIPIGSPSSTAPPTTIAPGVFP